MLHINAAAYGERVAEILHALVPLMREVGLDIEWQVIEGSEAFFEVTKACHNGLQGMEIPFTDKRNTSGFSWIYQRLTDTPSI